jgi:hypothetical protein
VVPTEKNSRLKREGYGISDFSERKMETTICAAAIGVWAGG